MCRMMVVAALVLTGFVAAGCQSNRLRAESPARGGLASAPIETPRKLEYPAGGEGVIFESGPVFIAGQPTEESLRRMVREHGITVVINLRTQQEMENRERMPFDEAAVLREMGVDYVNVPLGRPDHMASPEKVDEVAAALEAHEGRALLHCASATRASHVWAAYLIRHRGVDPDRAIADAAMIQPNRPMYADLIGADITVKPAKR